MSHAGLTIDPTVPTIREIDYAIQSLQDTLRLIRARQKLNDSEKADQVRLGNYSNAATHAAMEVGMLAAINMVHLEITKLVGRREAVQASHAV